MSFDPSNPLREKGHQLLIYGTTLRNQVLAELSPHPSLVDQAAVD
jgi:hypothetical protein